MRVVYILALCLIVGGGDAFATKGDNVVQLLCNKALSVAHGVKQSMPSLFRWTRMQGLSDTDTVNEQIKREMFATLAAASHAYAVDRILGRIDVTKPFDLDSPDIMAAAREHFEMSLVNLITNYGEQIKAIGRKRVSAEDYGDLHEAREYIRMLKPYVDASIARLDVEIAKASHIHRMNLAVRRQVLAGAVAKYAAWAPKFDVELPF